MPVMTVESIGHLVDFGRVIGPGPSDVLHRAYYVVAGTLNARVTLFCALVAAATILTLCLVASDKAHGSE